MENILDYLADKYTCCVKYWWMLLVLGIITLILGIFIFMFPGISYITMSLLFGVVILFSGIIYIIMSTSKTIRGKGWLLASGIIEVIIGIMLTMWPVIAAASLPYFLGFWLLFKGFTMIGIGSDLSDIKGAGWGWTIVSAILLIICAFIIFIQPVVFGVEAVIIWIGISLLIGGISLISFSMQLKSMGKHIN
ncbi:MAG: DUF308 domain-containing protein [Bacteroidales bacterium]